MQADVPALRHGGGGRTEGPPHPSRLEVPDAEVPVEIDEAREFIAENHRAVMHTFREDGSPQLSPVTVTIDGEGRAVVSTRESAVKTRNLERDPRASLCVMEDRFFGNWVRIDGTTTIVHLPEALEPLVDYYRRIRGEHDDWDEYRQAMRDQQRVLLRITVEEAGPDVSG